MAYQVNSGDGKGRGGATRKGFWPVPDFCRCAKGGSNVTYYYDEEKDMWVPCKVIIAGERVIDPWRIIPLEGALKDREIEVSSHEIVESGTKLFFFDLYSFVVMVWAGGFIYLSWLKLDSLGILEGILVIVLQLFFLGLGLFLAFLFRAWWRDEKDDEAGVSALILFFSICILFPLPSEFSPDNLDFILVPFFGIVAIRMLRKIVSVLKKAGFFEKKGVVDSNRD